MRFAALTAMLTVALIPSDIRSQEVEFTGPPLLLPDAGVSPSDAGLLSSDAGLTCTENRIDALQIRIVELKLDVDKIKRHRSKKPSGAVVNEDPKEKAVLINDVKMPQQPHSL